MATLTVPKMNFANMAMPTSAIEQEATEAKTYALIAAGVVALSAVAFFGYKLSSGMTPNGRRHRRRHVSRRLRRNCNY